MISIATKLKRGTVYSKLLKYGLFAERLTPIFTSEYFGDWVMEKGVSTFKEHSFYCVKYRMTRNNNAPRIIEIPHPIAYFRLCTSIKNNWSHIAESLGDVDDYSEKSMIIPKPNNLNKRLISMMSYDKSDEDKFLLLDKSLNKKVLVHIDIANCYPSIYSHSIPWALVGHKQAKDNSNKKKYWYNKLDFAIRSQRGNETVGIPIGPDTSALVSEIILSKVDNELSDFEYVRFIDDYKCYCKSQEEADLFIRTASKELEKYRLLLNTKKTKIVTLPVSLESVWVQKLRTYTHQFLNKKKLTNKDIELLSDFIDLAVNQLKTNPNDSAIRYAVKVLSHKKFTEEKVFTFIIMYLSRVCFIYPYFIDVFDKIFTTNKKHITPDVLKIIEVEINSICQEHIKYSRSDVALWALHLAVKYNFSLENFDNYSDKLIDKRDCLPVLLCYEYCKAKKISSKKKYFHLIKDIINEKIEDEWWIYIYQLFFDRQTNPVFKKINYKTFYIAMAKDNVSFLRYLK